MYRQSQPRDHAETPEIKRNAKAKTWGENYLKFIRTIPRPRGRVAHTTDERHSTPRQLATPEKNMYKNEVNEVQVLATKYAQPPCSIPKMKKNNRQDWCSPSPRSLVLVPRTPVSSPTIPCESRPGVRPALKRSQQPPVRATLSWSLASYLANCNWATGQRRPGSPHYTALRIFHKRAHVRHSPGHAMPRNIKRHHVHLLLGANTPSPEPKL